MDAKLLTEEVKQFLGIILSGGGDPFNPSSIVIEELFEFRPTESIVLYRGLVGEVKNDGRYIDKLPSSWSYKKEVAKLFIEGVDGIILQTEAEPEDVICDTTLFSAGSLIQCMSAFPEEREVILKPGVRSVSYHT